MSKTLEERVAALEAENTDLRQDLATAVTLMAGSQSGNPFKSPLEQFFEHANQLFKVDPLKEFNCRKDCAMRLAQMLQDAGDDEGRQQAALDAFSDCTLRCSGILP